MKKLLAVLLAATMVVVTFSGCSGENGTVAQKPDDSEKSGETVLTMWYWNRAVSDSLIENVSEKFPGITIKAEKISDLKTKIIATMAAGSGMPDILCMNDWMSDFMNDSQKFTNLLEAPYNANEIKDQFYDWKWDACLTPDGSSMMALPMDTGPTAMFYRADLFEQAGLPSDPEEVAKQINSWDALIEAGKVMKEKTGVTMLENIQRVFIYALSQKNQQYLDRSGKFIGDQAHVKECFDLAVRAQKAGIIYNADNWTPEWNAAVDNSDIACITGAFWMKKVLYDAGSSTEGKWKITDMPGGPGNNGGSFIGIPAESNHKEEAYKVIKWIVAPENQQMQLVSTETTLFPSSPKAFEGYKYEAEPFFGGQETNRVFVSAADNIPISFIGPKSQTFQDIYQEQLKLIADTDKDPEQAWKDAIEKCKAEMSR